MFLSIRVSDCPKILKLHRTHLILPMIFKIVGLLNMRDIIDQ